MRIVLVLLGLALVASALPAAGGGTPWSTCVRGDSPVPDGGYAVCLLGYHEADYGSGSEVYNLPVDLIQAWQCVAGTPVCASAWAGVGQQDYQWEDPEFSEWLHRTGAVAGASVAGVEAWVLLDQWRHVCQGAWCDEDQTVTLLEVHGPTGPVVYEQTETPGGCAGTLASPAGTRELACLAPIPVVPSFPAPPL